MSQKQDHTRLKYLVSYTLAMTAAFLTFKSFYIFQGSSKFGVETVGLNFGILLFLWFLSFIHTGFIRRNIFMVLFVAAGRPSNYKPDVVARLSRSQ